jgi:hypothetical protein
MKRRTLLQLTPCLALGAVRSASAEAAGPSYRISADQLQQALTERFPMRYEVRGLFDFLLQAPRLRLLPERNRISSEMAVRAEGPALRRSYAGEFDLDFALRYEPTDQTIRAHRLEVHSLRLPGLPPQAAAVVEGYGSALAAEALLEVVLHRLQPRDLALPDAMGLQPGDITVTPQGLVIGFVNKKRTP